MNDVVLYCIHGFLGKSEDWDSVFPKDWIERTGIQIEKISLFSKSDECLSESGLEEFAQKINLQARSKSNTTRPRILLGYSLGGRVGMHSLLAEPDLWSGAVIVSAHPGIAEGLKSEEERHQRLESDRKWAQRFRGDKWEPLISDWNSQAVFQGGGTPLERLEQDFSRTQLASLLENASLGVQRNLHPLLSELTLPILWISGESDVKYRDIVQLKVISKVIDGAGHRVPWDQPKLFQDCVLDFIEDVFR